MAAVAAGAAGSRSPKDAPRGVPRKISWSSSSPHLEASPSSRWGLLPETQACGARGHTLRPHTEASVCKRRAQAPFLLQLVSVPTKTAACDAIVHNCV